MSFVTRDRDLAPGHFNSTSVCRFLVECRSLGSIAMDTGLRWLLEGPNSLRRLASHTAYTTLDVSRCDLHIHCVTARSGEWLFRRLDFPDSYFDPKQLHEQLLKRGMDTSPLPITMRSRVA
jgi:hypothetical protein